MSTPGLPPVAVVYDLGSAGPRDVLRAARGLCRPVFVYDRADAHADQVHGLLAQLSGSCDITGLSAAEATARIAEHGVRGILTFAEYQIPRTAELATRLRLSYQDSETVRRLTDKNAQRAAFAAAGVDTTRHALIRRPSEVDTALAEVGLPAVLKPAVGGSSRNTHLVDTAATARALADQLLGTGAETRLVLEELLVGQASGDWGDYVSVESLTVHGATTHLAVTGKFPLSPPFRETGMFTPAELPERLHREVLDLAGRALAAIGFQHGMTHTEIKLTAHGPRLIEVNGRLGGHVADLALRSGGVDLVRLALAAALGEAPEAAVPTWERVAFQYFLVPPVGARRLRRLDGLDQVRSLPGISKVEVDDTPRELGDWRQGASSRLGVLYGSLSDHTRLRFVKQLIDETVRPEFEFDPEYAGLG